MAVGVGQARELVAGVGEGFGRSGRIGHADQIATGAVGVEDLAPGRIVDFADVDAVGSGYEGPGTTRRIGQGRHQATCVGQGQGVAVGVGLRCEASIGAEGEDALVDEGQSPATGGSAGQVVVDTGWWGVAGTAGRVVVDATVGPLDIGAAC